MTTAKYIGNDGTYLRKNQIYEIQTSTREDGVIIVLAAGIPGSAKFADEAALNKMWKLQTAGTLSDTQKLAEV